MEIVERARVRLEIEDADARVTLDSLKSEAKEINKELKRLKESGEEGSEGWQELRNRQREVNAELRQFTSNIDINDASMNELRARSRQLSTELGKLKVDSEEWLAKLAELKEVDGRIDQVRASMRDLGDEVEEHGKEGGLWSNMKGQVLAVFTGTGLLELAKGAGQAIFDIGKEIFETTAKFEKYDAVLTNALGSQEKAAAAMSDIKKFAAETPFSVDELTESYLKYVNRGLQPSMEEMRKMGDIAASQGKSFDQLTEAVLDAATGEFERLKEFGIQASKSGDQVELSFKGVNQTVKNTPEAIQGALLAFGELEGVAGGMAAISSTLEGRVSNLGDNYDNLQLIIGEKLKPVFGFLLDMMSYGLQVAQDLFSGTNPLSNLFESMGEIMGNVWQSGKALFESWFEGAQTSGYLNGLLEILTFSLKSTATSFLLGLTAVNAFFDAMNIVLNKGKEVANFFGAEFKIDPKANFDTLAANATKNFASIEKLWSDTNTKNVATTVATNAKIESENKKTTTKLSAEEQKALEKKQKDQEKAEEALQKKLESMRIKAIADDLTRKKAEINQKYDLEDAGIKKSLASQKTKDAALVASAKAREAEITKAETDARVKKEAEDKKLSDKKAADDKKKAEDKKKADDKTAADEKKSREDKAKESKALFDAEFSAEVAKAKNLVDLTKKNSQEMWDAKRKLLDTEFFYKQQQLENEAIAEKAKIEETVKDKEKQRIALLDIDAKLKAKLSSEEVKYQHDKTKVNEDQNKAREDNNKKFFQTLNAAMRGDFNSFMNFLKDKVKVEQTANMKRLQDFSDKTGQISDAALQGINTLKQINQQFLESQLSKIKAETSEQIASWEKQYNAGKISKEQFEAEKEKINQASAQKEKQARKDAFEREKKMNLASAVINTAQAALKSFAMFGWPLGAIMAALATVAGGIQIAAINRQKFEGRLGGLLNSEGKIFARSGASIPKNAFVSSGDRHGSKYGESGISMINRRTGEEVGEIEGGEPVMVLSRNTYKNNGPIVDKLLKSSLYNNGAPITMASGGVLTVSGKRMYQDGGVVGSSPEKVAVEKTESETKSEKELAKIREFVGNILAVLTSMKKQDDIPEFLDLITEELKKSNVNLEEIKKSGNILHLLDRVNANAQKSNL